MYESRGRRGKGEREGGKGEKEGEREERTLSHLFKFPELSKFLPLAKFSQGSQNYQNACKYTKENKHKTRHENYTSCTHVHAQRYHTHKKYMYMYT